MSVEAERAVYGALNVSRVGNGIALAEALAPFTGGIRGVALLSFIKSSWVEFIPALYMPTASIVLPLTASMVLLALYAGDYLRRESCFTFNSSLRIFNTYKTEFLSFLNHRRRGSRIEEALLDPGTRELDPAIQVSINRKFVTRDQIFRQKIEDGDCITFFRLLAGG